MRNTWAMGLALGLVVAAGSAGAVEGKGRAQQDGAQAQQPQRAERAKKVQADRSAEAAKHFAVANAGLESAEANAEMLFEITAKPELYDEAHGKLFVTNIKDAIAYSKAHIAHLEPLVQSDAEKRDLKLLNERVDHAQTMVQRLEGNTANVQQLHSEAGAIDRQLDQSQEPLQKLARSMKVPVDVG